MNPNNRARIWVAALRLRTLPLAVAVIILPASLALQAQLFRWNVFLASIATTFLLQILSNLANDYGDSVTGADNSQRIGPLRAMQTGKITVREMKTAIFLMSGASVLSGVLLLYLSLGTDWRQWAFFLFLGGSAIAAAITYTLGKFPYGYRALGDLSVFTFFGLAGVVGGYYLYDLNFYWALLLPASAIGFLSVSVLNINNIRDIYTYKAANKITLPVILGRKKAFIYHLALIFAAFLSALIYLIYSSHLGLFNYLFLLSLPIFIKISYGLNLAIKADLLEGERFNNILKNTVLASFFFSLLFSLSIIL